MLEAGTVPLLIPFWVTTERTVILEDVGRWLEVAGSDRDPGTLGLLELLAGYSEFRSIYHYRLRRGGLVGAMLSVCLHWIYPGQRLLYLQCPKIGPGLFVQHGFSTIVAAEQIGKNCWINQQVTIGFRDNNEGPRLGDNVVVNAGAKVIGPVRVGNNVTIGANAVVVKDVPDDCVVVGVPAYIVRRRGVRVHEALDKASAANC